MNRAKIDRLKKKRTDAEELKLARGPGRPSADGSTRPKRLKIEPKAMFCVFAQCDFCAGGTSDLHRVLTDNMGQTLLQLKHETKDDNVRMCVSDLQEVGDAAAQEKYYHRNCELYAKRTCSQVQLDQTKVIRNLCDEEFLLIVQKNLIDETVSVSIADLNDEYLSILKRYSVAISESGNYRKHLKALISDLFPNMDFVTSVRRNEPDMIVLKTTISKAVAYHTTMFDSSEVVDQLKGVASLLRNKILQYQSWTFKGAFDDFEYPPFLQFLLRRILFGQHASTKSQARNQEMDKTTNVACQFLIQNTKSDRHV